MVLEMREPTTGESTYPFFRYLGMPDWLERWEHFRSLAALRGDRHIPVEEYVEGDHLIVRAELPGIDPDKDVHVGVENGVLRIRAQRRQQTTTSDQHMYRSELHYGAFSRTLTLPVDAKPDDVQAIYKDGILTVRLPLDRARTEATKVPVSRE